MPRLCWIFVSAVISIVGASLVALIVRTTGGIFEYLLFGNYADVAD